MNVGEAGDTQESDNDTENDSQETESSSPETSTTFPSENPCEHCENSNVYGTLIMKCPKCSWHDYYKFCPMRYVITRFPREKLHQIIFGVMTGEKHKNANTLETNFYSPSKEDNEGDVEFDHMQM